MGEIFVPLPEARFGRTWRLGTTSYVYPADLATNLGLLAGRVDDVELVLFDTPYGSNFPSPAEVEAMGLLAEQHHLSFTVHFPIDHRLGSPDRKARNLTVREMVHLIELLGPLRPRAYISHLEGIEPADPPDCIRAWQQACTGSLRHALDAGLAPELICVENLGYPYHWSEPVIDALGLSVCIDIGHLWLTGTPVRQHLDRYLRRTRVIHLHGESGGQDHISLSYVDDERMEAATEALDGFAGVVTLEMFEQLQVANSISRLARAVAEHDAQTLPETP
jgi:sugar phosphate isomerase/epimerase